MMIKRFFDILMFFFLVIVFGVPMLLIALAVKTSSPGPVFYWSDRIGRHNKIFRMCKFRTMRLETPAVATHLLKDAHVYVTPLGSFLRKYSLDELPQLWNVLKGDMSFVGPRPALFNQEDLVRLRTDVHVHTLVPGITGWAQIHGRDDLAIPEKVDLDRFYLEHRSFWLDVNILFWTVFKVMRKEGVSH